MSNNGQRLTTIISIVGILLTIAGLFGGQGSEFRGILKWIFFGEAAADPRQPPASPTPSSTITPSTGVKAPAPPSTPEGNVVPTAKPRDGDVLKESERVSAFPNQRGAPPPDVRVKFEIIDAQMVPGARKSGYGIALTVRLSDPPFELRPFLARHADSGDGLTFAAEGSDGNSCSLIDGRTTIIPSPESTQAVLDGWPDYPMFAPGSEPYEFNVTLNCSKAVQPGTTFLVSSAIWYYVAEWRGKRDPDFPWKRMLYSTRIRLG